jgi:hypothetical protein
MRRRWRIVFPVFGLILFSTVSYRSYETQRVPSKYFYWSRVRLDSDPANKDNRYARPCEDGKENCTNWDLTGADRWVDPGLLDKILVFSALPAFVVGGLAVSGLGRLGVNQVSSFMFLMPILIAAWYYFIGRVFDRWTRKHSQQSTSTPE